VAIRNRIPPGVLLLVLAPMIGELLSGSSPPSEFFTPFGLIVILILYGGGALLAREFKIRWGKGMGTLLLLGASYGVIEEGIMVGSWFNPRWPDLGILGVFGRWLGVNWVWAVDLTIYHAIVSISVPIMLVELTYPDSSKQSWVTGRWFQVVAAAFVADVLFGLAIFGGATGYTPNPIQVLFAVIVAAFFLLAAKWLPSGWARNIVKPIKRPRYYLIYTFLGSVLCVGIFYMLPNLIEGQIGPPIVVIVGVALVLTLIRHLRYNWGEATGLHKLAICTGSLGILILLTPIQELDRTRTDNTRGMIIVGLTTVILLLLLRRKISRRARVTLVESV
jgi:hypothetical protein